MCATVHWWIFFFIVVLCIPDIFSLEANNSPSAHQLLSTKMYADTVRNYCLSKSFGRELNSECKVKYYRVYGFSLLEIKALLRLSPAKDKKDILCLAVLGVWDE